MKTTHKRVVMETIPCQVCLSEVAKDEASVAEARDYIVFFCGLDCYERWRRGEAAQRERPEQTSGGRASDAKR